MQGKDKEPSPQQNLEKACCEYLEAKYGSDVFERLNEILYYKQTIDKKGRKKRDVEEEILLKYSGKISRSKILSLLRMIDDSDSDSDEEME